MARITWKKWKWPIIIVAAVVVVMAVSALLYRRGHTHRIYLRWKAEGIAASQAGDHKLAIYDLRSYLSVYFDDQDALRAYIHSRPLVNVAGDRATAVEDTIFALRHLINLETDTLADRRALIKLYRSAGQDTEAVDAADQLLAVAANDKEAIAAKTTALANLKRWNEALTAAQSWCDVDPADINCQMAVLVSMHELSTPMAEIVKRARDFGQGRRDSRAAFLVGYALAQDERGGKHAVEEGKNAAEWFHLAAGDPPADAKFVMALTQQFDRLGLYDDSLAVLRKADSGGVGAPIRRELFCRLWPLNAWPEIASRCKGSRDVSDSEVVGISAIALNKTGEAAEGARLRKLLSGRPDDRMAAAWVQVFDNAGGAANLPQLIGSCDAALAEVMIDAPLHFICGNANLARGNTFLAVQELNNAAACSPSWALPMARAAEVHLRRGEIDAAMAEAEQAMHLAFHDNVVSDASLAITAARVVFAAKQAGRSVNVAALGRLVAAVQQAKPGEPETLEIQAALFAEAGRTEDAKANLKRLIESPKAPDERSLLRVASLSRSMHLALENQAYQRSEQEHGMTPTLAFDRAVALLREGDQAGGLKLLNDSSVKAGQLDRAAWRMSVCYYLELCRDPATVAAWTKLGDEMPDVAAVQRAAIHSPAAASDRDFNERTIQRLRSLTGEKAPEWRLARARALLGDPKCSPQQQNEARDILQDTLRNDPASAEAHWVYGALLEKQNDALAATREFRAAADLDPTSPRFAIELTRLMKTPKEIAELKQRLQCVADGPNATAPVLMQLAWLHEQADERDGAEKCYRRALSLNPNLPPAQNNLAMLLIRTRRTAAIQEAVALASAAAKQQPQNASFLDTLAHAYEACGQLPDAIDSMSKAIALSPKKLNFRLSLIEWLITSGRRDDARTSLQGIEQLKIDTSGIDEDLRSRLILLREKLK